jgi:hypothetical protein
LVEDDMAKPVEHLGNPRCDFGMIHDGSPPGFLWLNSGGQ